MSDSNPSIERFSVWQHSSGKIGVIGLVVDVPSCEFTWLEGYEEKTQIVSQSELGPVDVSNLAAYWKAMHTASELRRRATEQELEKLKRRTI